MEMAAQNLRSILHHWQALILWPAEGITSRAKTSAPLTDDHFGIMMPI
jgi:hypothetical protein